MAISAIVGHYENAEEVLLTYHTTASDSWFLKCSRSHLACSLLYLRTKNLMCQALLLPTDIQIILTTCA